MKSLKFEILRDNWPQLAGVGTFAESYAHAGAISALVKLLLFGENLTKAIYREHWLAKPDRPTLVDLLESDVFTAVTPKVVLDKLHALRIRGTKAAHGEPVRVHQALWLLKETHELVRRMCVRYGQTNANQLSTFQKPAIPSRVDERERRQILEKLAAQESQMDALLSELEEARSEASADQKEAAELNQLARSAQAVADELHFDEAETRTRLIDSMLASVGWDIAEGIRNTAQVGKEVLVDGQPTASGTGYADYVLWDDYGNPLAAIMAKIIATNAEIGCYQANLYADGLEKRYGHRPVNFYTNGFDIWIWDDAQKLPRESSSAFTRGIVFST